MSLPILVITGSELVLAKAGEVVVREPCMAHLGGRDILFGKTAEARARLAPGQIEDRYWDDLSDAALSISHRRAGSSADLVFLQIDSLMKRVELTEPVLLATHAGYDRDQLALLLGMFAHLPVPAVGLVDTAVAALSDAVAGRYRVLEPTRHGVVVSDVDVAQDGSEVVLVDAQLRTESGLANYFEACAEAVCAAFVKATRFDPMASLETEQALFDQLPAWLHAMGSGGRPEAVLRHGGEEYVLQLGLEILPRTSFRLAQVLASLVDPVRQMVVTDHAITLPGLCLTIPRVRQRSFSSVLRGIERNLGHIRHDPPALPWLRRLPWAGEVDAVLPGLTFTPSRPAAVDSNGVAPVLVARDRPTHILIGATACPLPEQGKVRVSPDGMIGVTRALAGLELELSPGLVRALPLIDSVWLDGRRLTVPADLMPGAVVEVGAHPCRFFVMSPSPVADD